MTKAERAARLLGAAASKASSSAATGARRVSGRRWLLAHGVIETAGKLKCLLIYPNRILKFMLNCLTPLDRAFQALADPTRRAMVERLSQGPASVSELKRPLVMSLPAVMQHLAVLEAPGSLFRKRQDGCAPAALIRRRSLKPSAGSPTGA